MFAKDLSLDFMMHGVYRLSVQL